MFIGSSIIEAPWINYHSIFTNYDQDVWKDTFSVKRSTISLIVVFRSKIRLCANIKGTQYCIRINSRGSVQFKIVSKFTNDKYYFYYLVYTNHQNRYGLKGDWNFGMGFCRCNTLKILGAVILSRKLSVQRALLIPKKLTWWSWPPWKVLGFFENKKNWLKN